MATSESDVAAKLIERLLVDPAFRARFRRNPAEACREAGLEELAQEMSIGAGKAMMTLDLRESKSSLAGVMMAAAMEGVGVMQFVEHVAPHLDDIPEAIGDVLSRVNLPAIGGALGGGPKPSAPALPDAGGGGGAGADGIDGADPGVDPSAAGNGAAPAAAPPADAAAPAAASPAAAPAAATPEAAPAADGKAGAATPEPAGAKPRGGAGDEASGRGRAAEQAAEKIAKQESPESKTAEEAQKAVAGIKENAQDLPGATDLPDETDAPQASVDVGADPKAAAAPPAAATPEQAAAAPPAAPAAAAPATPEQAAAAPPAAAPPGDPAAQPSGRAGAAADVTDAPGGGKSHPVDPTEYGQSGHGGSLSPEAAQLLKNKNLEFDSVGVADLKAGKIDPRVVAVLTKLSGEHKLKISCMCSDHPKFTSGGSISNHSLGRGLDIASVDGEIVNPGSAAARELASELSHLPEKYRPDEIGSPWPISGPGYFTDAAHQDHVHVGFKTEIPKDWAPPEDVNAGDARAGAAAVPAVEPAAPAPAVPAAAPAAPAAPAAAVAPGAPAAAAAAVPGAPKVGDSGQFMAAAAHAADAKGASGQFMAAPTPLGPASALAHPASVPGMVDAAAAGSAAPGGSSLGASALKVAQGELAKGVHETGVNTGAEVDKYLKEAGVGPGNPWCASFVTWSLAQSGHKMPGSGWAAVQTWVQNAEAGKNDLQVVSADEARPGDIVAYDWGGQDDFGSDGHIGFVASNVKDGKFTALEGNNSDAVMKVPRQTSGANVKFIRIGGNATPPAGTEGPATPAAPAAGAAPAAPAGAAGAAVPQGTPAGGASVADAAAAATDLGGSGNRYPGDDAPKEQLAAWLGKEAEKRGLPKELPVMASLVESGVKNIHYGDADSVGFFQMRVGIWNKGPYAGFPEKPGLQAKWFLDQAEAVKKQRIAAGKSVTDPNQYGDWIADIERPAEQYRGRYGMRLHEANALLNKAAGSAPAGRAGAAADLAGAPVAPAAAPAGAAADAAASAVGGGGGAGPQALAALKEAEKYKGTAYKWGGSTPQTGFDCSGLVQWAYAKAGIQIPRVTEAQFTAGNGTPVDKGHLKPGDLIFFGKPGNIYHVAISMGGDKFLHAPKTGDVVKVASLKESYFAQNFAGGRRFDHHAAVAGPVAAPAAPADGAVPAPAAAPAPAIDPKAIAEAQAAVARDAAEVNRANSGLFMAVKAQEERRHATVQFMKAIDPKQANGDAAAAAPPAAAAAAAPADPAAAPADAAAPAAAADRSADAGPPIQLPDDISDDYPGNRASKDELAKWLAKQADKHGLPPELPVMASLVESGVKNINYGDADSVGFFQMRVGTWNQGAYKGFPDHPELQAKWFIDQALAVKKQRIAAGDANFGKDPSKWGDWIADIERPAEQYRGRYQLRLREARGLLGS